jgi:hypothetical protein
VVYCRYHLVCDTHQMKIAIKFLEQNLIYIPSKFNKQFWTWKMLLPTSPQIPVCLFCVLGAGHLKFRNKSGMAFEWNCPYFVLCVGPNPRNTVRWEVVTSLCNTNCHQISCPTALNIYNIAMLCGLSWWKVPCNASPENSIKILCVDHKNFLPLEGNCCIKRHGDKMDGWGIIPIGWSEIQPTP